MGTSAVKSSLKLPSANMRFVNCFGLKIPQIFRTQKSFSKTAAKYIYLRTSRLHMFYISYFDVMLKSKEEQVFMDFF